MSIIKGLLIASFVYNLLLIIVYFSKMRINSWENKLYSFLLSINLVGILLEFICIISSQINPAIGQNLQESFLVTLIARLYLLYLLIWITTFSTYVFSISFNKDAKVYKFIMRYKKLFWSIAIILIGFFILSSSMFPMYFYNDGVSAYTWGPAIDSLIILFSLSVAFCLANALYNVKNIHFKKYLPVYAFVVGLLCVVIPKMINPEIQLVATILTFITILMFFTIENPDLQMVNELSENRKLIEKQMEAKENFIFNVSQEIREPLHLIEDICDDIKSQDNHSIIKEKLNDLKANVREINFVVSNILDVSTMDAHNIKVTNNKYNIHNLLKEITMKIKAKTHELVDVRLDISSNVPEFLYGDSSRIKQVLMTILLNSCKYTQKGFIELHCGAVLKYDACKLTLIIEDSGAGMDIKMVNKLMSAGAEELTEDEINRLDKLDLNFNLISKIVKHIGGNILVKSEVGKGTKVILVLPQKNAEKSQSSKIINNYTSEKKVLLLTDKKEELNLIKSKFQNKSIDVVSTMHFQDAINRLLNKEKFDLILIEDEMKSISGLETYFKIKQIDEKVPAIILINKKQEKIIKAYLSDGFVDAINKDKLNLEVERIIKKHL